MKKIFLSLLLGIFVISLISATPSVTLESPADNANLSTLVNFTCSATESSFPINQLVNITIYGNWSGGWHANETTGVSGSSANVSFLKDIPEGKYVWNCLATNTPLGETSFATSNRTFTVDKTPPAISSVQINESFLCGTSSLVRVNCTTTDSSGISSVKIESTSPSGTKTNHTASFLSGDTYFSDIVADEIGIWDFSCIVNDTAGNTNSSGPFSLEVFHTVADPRIDEGGITFSSNNPYEGQSINVFANVYNKGCQAANDFWTAFYIGDPDSGGQQQGSNKSLSIPARSNQTANISWTVLMGPSNFFVKTDINDTISEGNESNNKANKTIQISAWQDFFGAIGSTKLLSNSIYDNMTLWFNESTSTGNIFIIDIESVIDWSSLIAIGRNISGSQTLNDFSDIDSLFNMSSFNDSTSNRFTTDGNSPKQTDNFTIQSSLIENVPIINSTNNTNFETGILWDSSDDSGDGEFSQGDNEDLVMVTKINKNSLGAYGTYDYEITIPAKIREQDPTDSSEIYFFYELA